METKTIIIAGGGISGMVAAITLASAGHRVDVHEKNPGIGMRFAGDFQGVENWTQDQDVLTELSIKQIDLNFDYTPFSKLTVSDGAVSRDVFFKRPAFYVVRRGNGANTLDQSLYHQAVSKGVKFFFNSHIDPTKADIVATGPLPGHIIGIVRGMVFKTGLTDMAIGVCNNTAAWKGYGYLLVTNGMACLCTMVLEPHKQDLQKSFNHTKSIIESITGSLTMDGGQRVGGVGSYRIAPIFQDGPQRYVGEASGLQDIIWGFGIRTAVTSGWLSAQSIITGTSYQERAQEQFLSNHHASLVGRFFWENIGLRYSSFFINRVSNAKDPLNLMKKYYSEHFLTRPLYKIAKGFLKRRYPIY